MVSFNFSYLALFPALAWAVTTIVDDSDSQIQFDSTWRSLNDHVLDGGINTNYWGGTTHASTTPGGTVSFVFTGTGITYYGDVDVDNADFIVEIDQTSTRHSAKDPAGFKSNQVLFSVSGLSNTQHTLTIKHSGANGEWATLDRLVYESDTPPSVVTNVATVTIDGIIATGSQGLPTTAISTISPTPQNQAAGLPTGAIIGIAVGGAVILIILIAFLIIFLRRKRRLQANVQATHEIDFLESEYPQPQAPVSQWVSAPFNLAAAAPSGGNYAPVPHKPQNLSPAPVVPSLLPPSYDDIESNSPPSVIAQSSTYDPYNDSEYTPSSSAYAPSSVGIVHAAGASSSSAPRTYPVDRKVRPT